MSDQASVRKGIALGALAGVVVALALFAGTFAAGMFRAAPLPTLAPMGEWSLVDHDGNAFGSRELAGQVWVANFIFTRCLAACPRITAAMREVESELARNDGVQFVSFTVDPAFDKSSILKAYRQKYAIESDRWHFVTGDEKAVYALLRDKMFSHIGEKISRGDPKDGLIDIAHLERFALFGRGGNLRATASIDAGARAELFDKIDALVVESMPGATAE